MNKGIFTIKEQNIIDILNEYIELSLFEYGKKSFFSKIIDCCFCINFNSVVSYHNIYDKDISSIKSQRDDKSDDFIEWILRLSLSYLRTSGIDTVPLTSFFIECISTNDSVLLKNSKDATVIFHLNVNQGYITIHKNGLNCLLDDKKYLIVSFTRS